MEFCLTHNRFDMLDIENAGKTTSFGNFFSSTQLKKLMRSIIDEQIKVWY